MGKSDFGRVNNRGCNNGRWYMTDVEPEEPKQNDVWFDMNFLLLKYYDGSAWQPFYGTGQQYKLKTVNEGLASTTTVQNDDDLVINNLESNSVYEIKLYMTAYGPTAADIKVAWATGGSSAQKTLRHCIGPATSTTNNLDTNAMIGCRGLGSANPYGTDPSIWSNIQETFLVETTGSTGSLQVTWAQNTSNATRTTVTLDSYIAYRRIS